MKSLSLFFGLFASRCWEPRVPQRVAGLILVHGVAVLINGSFGLSATAAIVGGSHS